MKIVEESVTVVREHAYCDHGHEFHSDMKMLSVNPPQFNHEADDGCEVILDTTYPRITSREVT